jgi:cation diffusion facilitator CzcD-associated flavoprotein CzcO
MSNPRREFTVIGSGPYGLAVASHLRTNGAQVRIFGRPMDFWHSQMPEGMLLRSPWLGSNIADADDVLTLERYESHLGTRLDRHLRLEDFVRYGQWYQRQALPDLDTRYVSALEPAGAGYQVTLEDGDTFESHNVVVATGIGYFPNRPGPFRSLTTELVSHASDTVNRKLSRFAGKRVAVIGAGQSAIESAALLSEQGVDVEVLIRRPELQWLRPRWPKLRPLINWALDTRLNPLRAPARIGSSHVGWLVERPALVKLLPRHYQDALGRFAIRPAASEWLYDRVTNVTISPNQEVESATPLGGRVRLRLKGGGDRIVDHVLLATGYKVDISRYGFLSPQLQQRLRTAHGFPVLNHGFESSSAGLYFVGAPAAYSFGPLLRFVVGTRYAARTLSRYALRGAARYPHHEFQTRPATAR